MAPQNYISDILRKETVRIILERFQGGMISKMDDFPDEDVVCENIEEQLDNAYVNRKGVPLAMDIFKPKVDEYTELPVIVVIHGGGLVMGDRKISRKFSRMLAQKGYLVFSPLVYDQHGENPGCGSEAKALLDMAAKMKINYSHIVLVVDVDGYVGESTSKQIDYAKLLNKPVLYYSKGEVDRL